jgi:hypothetical protein
MDIIMNVGGAVLGAGTALIAQHSLAKPVRRHTN